MDKDNYLNNCKKFFLISIVPLKKHLKLLKNEDIDELIKKLGETDENADQVTFEFEFFTGEKNQKFDLFIKKYGLTNQNILFVDFLPTDYCKEILQSNDLKIYIETDNIYYQDTDTNGSIFEFMKNQQDTSRGLINTYLKFDGSYKSYFQWILNEFDAQQKTRYDIFSLRNTKYLIHRFDDFQNSVGKPLIKIRHTLVTGNYLVAEETQNQD